MALKIYSIEEKYLSPDSNDFITEISFRIDDDSDAKNLITIANAIVFSNGVMADLDFKLEKKQRLILVNFMNDGYSSVFTEKEFKLWKQGRLKPSP